MASRIPAPLWYTTLCLLLAPAGLYGQAGPPAGIPGAPHPAGAAQVPPQIAAPLKLTDAQVNGFLGAVDELQAVGAVPPGGKPSGAEAYAQGLRLSGNAEAVLQKHGFANATEFRRVAYNAGLAYGVLKQGGKAAVQKNMAEAKAEQARALEMMQQHLTPEQMKMLAGQMDSAMGMAASMQEVPEENVELIKKYADRMEKLGKR